MLPAQPQRIAMARRARLPKTHRPVALAHRRGWSRKGGKDEVLADLGAIESPQRLHTASRDDALDEFRVADYKAPPTTTYGIPFGISRFQNELSGRFA